MGYLFLLFFSKWVNKYYNTSLKKAEELLKEIEILAKFKSRKNMSEGINYTSGYSDVNGVNMYNEIYGQEATRGYFWQ